VWLLDLRHEDPGMSPKILVESGGTALWGAHDEEIRLDGQGLRLLVGGTELSRRRYTVRRRACAGGGAVAVD
jgi:hypothetical protein